MSKHAHHVSEAKDQHGEINQLIAVQHALEACAAIIAGKLTIVSMEQGEVAGHPGRVKFIFEAVAHV